MANHRDPNGASSVRLYVTPYEPKHAAPYDGPKVIESCDVPSPQKETGPSRYLPSTGDQGEWFDVCVLGWPVAD